MRRTASASSCGGERRWGLAAAVRAGQKRATSYRWGMAERAPITPTLTNTYGESNRATWLPSHSPTVCVAAIAATGQAWMATRFFIHNNSSEQPSESVVVEEEEQEEEEAQRG